MGRLEPMAGGGALQAKQPARTRGGASNTPLRDRVAEQPRLDVQPVAPDAALGALTFGEFVKAVLARNGNKNFTTGHNDGPNAYTTLEGQQIGFDIGNGIVIRPMPQKLVDGDFLSSDVPGRITIRGYRNGETLVLDDTHPAAPVYSFRHDLRYNKFDNERLRDPMMKP
jgi:hypothetical protein